MRARFMKAMVFLGAFSCAHPTNHVAPSRTPSSSNGAGARSATPSGSATSQPPSVDPTVAKYIDKEWIRPVVSGLRRRPGLARETKTLLKRLKLRTETTPRPSVGPNAIAFLEDGQPIVQVDVPFLAQLNGIADFAGLALTGMDEAGELLRRAGFLYSQQLVTAVKAGQEPPALRVKASELTKNPAILLAVDLLAIEATLATVTWVILHEVGHHVEGHFARAPASTAESREWELAADRWAFGEMQRMGYGLHPLQAVLAALATHEEILRVAGLELPEETSTHPKFATRLAALEEFRPDQPPRANWLMITHIQADQAGKWAANTLWIPASGDMGHLLAFYQQPTGTVAMPYEHFQNGEIHVYGRTQNDTSEIIVHDRNALRPEITLRFGSVGGQVTEEVTRGVQLDPHYWEHASVGGLAVWQILEANPIDLFAATVYKVESTPGVRRQARAIQETMLARQRRTLIDYARGNILLAESMQQMSRTSQQASDALKQLLGQEKYDRLQAQLLADPLIKSLSQQGPKM